MSIHHSPWLSSVFLQCARQAISLTTAVNDTVTIVCNISSTFPLWRGPPSSTLYNYENDSQFNPALGSKLDRLTWAANNRDLVIERVQLSDAGRYQCTVTGAMETVLEVRGKCIFSESAQISVLIYFRHFIW